MGLRFGNDVDNAVSGVYLRRRRTPSAPTGCLNVTLTSSKGSDDAYLELPVFSTSESSIDWGDFDLEFSA